MGDVPSSTTLIRETGAQGKKAGKERKEGRKECEREEQMEEIGRIGRKMNKERMEMIGWKRNLEYQ